MTQVKRMTLAEAEQKFADLAEWQWVDSSIGPIGERGREAQVGALITAALVCLAAAQVEGDADGIEEWNLNLFWLHAELDEDYDVPTDLGRSNGRTA